ncbi:MAG TPA: AraC family transcriptional regulator [Burkholderiaceae bacterium]|nr:AraC family transcriptional regulator [Burkholderiaceae bacterium]
MDALSDVLRALRISGGVFLDAAFTAPWCVVSRVGPEDFPNGDLPPSVVGFHYVIDGQMVVQIEGAPSVVVGAGEMVLLPRNDPHLLSSAAGLRPDPDPPVQRIDGGLMRIVCGGGGAATRLVCGYVGSEVRRHPLLEALPTALALDVKGKPCADWVAASFRFAAQEVASGRAASETVLAKLSELLFVEAVRHYAENLPPDRRGWFAGLRDPAVGRTLALMHARVAYPWTTEELAAAVHLSRSAFAERFTQLVGVPPITYLSDWRMQIATARLRDTPRSIGQIAAELGYESEATFTRAFKRATGSAPGRFRTAR